MPVAWITEIYNNSSKPIQQWCNQPPGPHAHLGAFMGKVSGKARKNYDPGNKPLELLPGDNVKAEWCGIPWHDVRHFR